MYIKYSFIVNNSQGLMGDQYCITEMSNPEQIKFYYYYIFRGCSHTVNNCFPVGPSDQILCRRKTECPDKKLQKQV